MNTKNEVAQKEPTVSNTEFKQEAHISKEPAKLTQPVKAGLAKKTALIKTKLRAYTKLSGVFYFWCPGCSEHHSVHTDKVDLNGAMHLVTGTPDAPTVSSMISRTIEPFNKSKHANNREYICNSFIIDGKIRFLENCTHPLAGKTVDLPYVD